MGLVVVVVLVAVVRVVVFGSGLVVGLAVGFEGGVDADVTVTWPR